MKDSVIAVIGGLVSTVKRLAMSTGGPCFTSSHGIQIFYQNTNQYLRRTGFQALRIVSYSHSLTVLLSPDFCRLTRVTLLGSLFYADC